MNDYASFSVLVDTPSDQPALRFEDYAQAFSEIIQRSPAQFSIGIFGGWGSGKTTLMRAIWERIDQESIVPVWFNAWRYEREPHLLVPMLDILREALVTWGQEQGRSAYLKRLAGTTAARVSRATRAIAAGISVSARLQVLDASYEPGKALEEWRRSDPDNATHPKSFYHAGFLEMESALETFTRHRGRRIVVFVDDLDRCLPDKALDVLESMKLFFDLPGFVFVVGLDQSIIERSVVVKYKVVAGEGVGDGPTPVNGSEYVKKIFQVPFGVPPIRPGQLAEFLETVKGAPQVSGAQRADLSNVVWPHLKYLAEGQSVNPREIKRFINSYTLQLKLLAPRLGGALEPNKVLAIQAMNFRSDWRALYNILAADPVAFSNEIDAALTDGFWPDRKRTVVPRSFINYVENEGSVLKQGDLDPYISSAEATQYTDTTVLDLSISIRDLWRAWGGVTNPEAAKDSAPLVKGAIASLSSRSSHLESTGGESLMRQIRELAKEGDRLAPEMSDDQLNAWRDRFAKMLESIEDDVDERRRSTGVGAIA
jgi:hypothetical protein